MRYHHFLKVSAPNPSSNADFTINYINNQYFYFQ